MYVKIPPGPSNFQSNEKSHHAKHGSCRTYVAVVVFINLVPTLFVIVLNQLSSTLDMRNAELKCIGSYSYHLIKRANTKEITMTSRLYGRMV